MDTFSKLVDDDDDENNLNFRIARNSHNQKSTRKKKKILKKWYAIESFLLGYNVHIAPLNLVFAHRSLLMVPATFSQYQKLKSFDNANIKVSFKKSG